MIKGFLDNTNVLLSSIKFKCLNFEPENFKTFEWLNVNKEIEIKNIKGFKAFLRTTANQEFKNIYFSNGELQTEGYFFIKEVTENKKTFICIYQDNKRIVSLNSDYLKPIFRELKDLNSLKFSFNTEEIHPVYFELNKTDGFVLAPCMREYD